MGFSKGYIVSASFSNPFQLVSKLKTEVKTLALEGCRCLSYYLFKGFVISKISGDRCSSQVCCNIPVFLFLRKFCGRSSALIVIYFFELRKENIFAASLLRDSVNVKSKITTTQKSIEGFNDTKIDSRWGQTTSQMGRERVGYFFSRWRLQAGKGLWVYRRRDFGPSRPT